MGEVSDLLYEWETVITFNDGEDIARVYTASPTWMRKFDRLCELENSPFRLTDISRAEGQTVGKFCEFPKLLVSIRAKKVERHLTDEQRAALSGRMKETRRKQKGGTAMTTPKGVKYIDVTYMAERIDYEQGDGVFTGEASIRLLVAEDVAAWLVEGGEIAADYKGRIEEIAAHREMLCHGRYVDNSVSVRIVDDGEGT